MADTKYLQRRGRQWYIRVPSPPKEWGLGEAESGKPREFVASLATADLKTAQQIRDRYLTPLLAATYAGRFVQQIAEAAAQADAEIAERFRELRPGLTGLPTKTLTLRTAADQFVAYLRSSRSYAPASLRKYAASLDAACQLLGPDADVNGLTKRDATGLRDTLLTLPATWQRRAGPPIPAQEGERKLSATSVERHLQDLRRLFRWLLGEGRVSRKDNPFDGVGVARVSPGHKRAPTPEEAETLMGLPRPDAIAALTWRAMPMLARYTGCRVSELAQLRGEDVVQTRGVRCFRVTGQGPGRSVKTVASERLVPVADKLEPLVNELLRKRKKGRLLDAGDYKAKDGTVKYAHGFLKHWNRRAKKVAPDLSFHCWRVYANDAMATAGVDIGDRERLLGHKSDRTQAAYTPENLERLKRAVDSIP